MWSSNRYILCLARRCVSFFLSASSCRCFVSFLFKFLFIHLNQHTYGCTLYYYYSSHLIGYLNWLLLLLLSFHISRADIYDVRDMCVLLLFLFLSMSIVFLLLCVCVYCFYYMSLPKLLLSLVVFLYSLFVCLFVCVFSIHIRSFRFFLGI